MTLYLVAKQVHVTTVVITLTLFVLRGAWMLLDSPWLAKRWVRIVPHVNDTVLLTSAVVLAVMLYRSPLAQEWIIAKVAALIVYIGLGMLALRPGRDRRLRAAAWGGALLVFGYIVSVAFTKSPLGPLLFL
jgi:uncharacterized membrane protein SirB2